MCNARKNYTLLPFTEPNAWYGLNKEKLSRSNTHKYQRLLLTLKEARNTN